MKEENFTEMICPTCNRKNKVRYFTRDYAFNEWQEVHCAYCGLEIESVYAASTPEATLEDESEKDGDENEPD